MSDIKYKNKNITAKINMKKSEIVLINMGICVSLLFANCNKAKNTYQKPQESEIETKSVIDLSLFDVEKDFNIKDFNQFSKDANFNKWHFIDKINPDKYYFYWECIYFEMFSDKRNRYVYNGDSLQFAERTKNITSDSGFFYECEPGICFSYIVAVDSIKNIELIDSNEKFRRFIGDIDNIEEVILIARTYNLYVDNDNKIGGAYREKGDYYLLYLMQYESCPYRLTSNLNYSHYPQFTPDLLQ